MKPFYGQGMGVALAAALVGCGGFNLGSLNPWRDPVERARETPADASVYACSDAKRLVVRHLAGSSSVMIVFPEREFRLDQAPSAPGRFTNGSTTFVSTGEEASLEEDGKQTHANCRKAAA